MDMNTYGYAVTKWHMMRMSYVMLKVLTRALSHSRFWGTDKYILYMWSMDYLVYKSF